MPPMTQAEIEQGLLTFFTFSSFEPTVSCMSIAHELYRAQRELFYSLAVVGISENAPQGMKNLAALAKNLRSVRLGFEILKRGRGGVIRFFDQSPAVVFEDLDVDVVQVFCDELRSGPREEPDSGKLGRMRGVPVSQAWIEFSLGD